MHDFGAELVAPGREAAFQLVGQPQLAVAFASAAYGYSSSANTERDRPDTTETYCLLPTR